jgi:hypothetical protein
MRHFAPVPRQVGNRMPVRRRWTFYVVFCALAASGVVWLVDHVMRSDDVPLGLVAPWSMKVHGAAAMLSLFGFGLLWDAHVRRGWTMKKSRLSGSIVGLVMLLLATSGFGLYYFDGEQLRRATEWLHWIVGGLSIVILLWHLLAARRIRRARVMHSGQHVLAESASA